MASVMSLKFLLLLYTVIVTSAPIQRDPREVYNPYWRYFLVSVYQNESVISPASEEVKTEEPIYVNNILDDSVTNRPNNLLDKLDLNNKNVTYSVNLSLANNTNNPTTTEENTLPHNDPFDEEVGTKNPNYVNNSVINRPNNLLAKLDLDNKNVTNSVNLSLANNTNNLTTIEENTLPHNDPVDEEVETEDPNYVNNSVTNRPNNLLDYLDLEDIVVNNSVNLSLANNTDNETITDEKSFPLNDPVDEEFGTEDPYYVNNILDDSVTNRPINLLDKFDLEDENVTYSVNLSFVSITENQTIAEKASPHKNLDDEKVEKGKNSVNNILDNSVTNISISLLDKLDLKDGNVIYSVNLSLVNNTDREASPHKDPQIEEVGKLDSNFVNLLNNSVANRPMSLLDKLDLEDENVKYSVNLDLNDINNNQTIIEETMPPYKELLRSGCGFHLTEDPIRDSRIVGGVQVQPQKYPWVISILRRGYFSCGGTLITSTYVLTAAHCVMRASNRILKVKSMHMVRNVEKIYIHPEFFVYSHDAAILKITSKFPFPVPTVCVANMKAPEIGDRLRILGRGSLKEKGPPSENLHTAEIEILPDEKCKNKYGNYFNKNFFCAGDPSGVPDACQGDSGGPLIKKVGNSYYQIGIVSFGDGCGRPDSPGVYSKVELLFDWIKGITSHDL